MKNLEFEIFKECMHNSKSADCDLILYALDIVIEVGRKMKIGEFLIEEGLFK